MQGCFVIGDCWVVAFGLVGFVVVVGAVRGYIARVFGVSGVAGQGLFWFVGLL